jgi:hypothetical protein
LDQPVIYEQESKTMFQPTLDTADGELPVNEEGQSLNGSHLEPRCRVCRNDALRPKVNDLLARGCGYALIVRALEVDNGKLDARDRVTIDSIRNHCARHFPVQNAAKASYREIIERRAQEAGVDFVNGVATALTPVAYFETILVKAYKTLVDSDTKVDASTGLAAAARLQAYMDAHSAQADIAAVYVKQNRIIAAIQEFVPPEEIPAFIARIEGGPQPQTEAAADRETTEVEEFDPDIGDDDDDELD